MSDPSKRTFTDGDRVAFDQLDKPATADTPSDIALQLRNIGSRVRKSVTEGYLTAPSSRVFNKAQSTSTIFTSAKDINRDIFEGNSSRSSRINDAQPHRKRTRSASDAGSETEPEDNGDSLMATGDKNPARTMNSEVKGSRVIKPLRMHRGMVQTRSLPVGAFRFSAPSLNPDTTMLPTMEPEEDWSVPPLSRPDLPAFEPVAFE